MTRNLRVIQIVIITNDTKVTVNEIVCKNITLKLQATDVLDIC